VNVSRGAVVVRRRSVRALVPARGIGLGNDVMASRLAPLLLTFALGAASSHAVVAGGGKAATDCAVVWDGVTATKGATTVACEDGDPACDVDGAINGSCTLGVNVCLLAGGIEGCLATAVDTLKVSPVLLAAGGVVQTPLVPPATPASSPACGTGAVVRLPLRGKARPKRSRRFVVKARATTTIDGKRKLDKDRLVLRCLPSGREAECPANPAGGPRELRLVVPASGTDLDDGWIGIGHSFPLVGGSTIRGCLSGCDAATNPTCTVDADTGPGTTNPAFGPPLPTLVVGSATCLINRYDSRITGTADLATGAIDLAFDLTTEVWITPPGIVCPQCSGDAIGDTGVCLSGPDKGRACQVEGTVVVADVGNTPFKLSSRCRPEGTLVGKLDIPIHVTTGQRTLSGPLPCDGQLETNACASPDGCTATCTGDACVEQVPDPVTPEQQVCRDRKGGLSQRCCADDATVSCFPNDEIVRTGRATQLTPPWGDPTYPKTGTPVLVDAFCVPATGTNLLDAITTGLPGPGAVIMPARACYADGQPCP
jgi:hypothetical protein